MSASVTPALVASPTQRATFNPLIRPYLVLYGAVVMAATIVGIPLAILWVCGVGQWWARHYFDKLECELSPVSLRFRKGILVQVEKTIPLENIQDVTFIEGPLLKRFHLSILKFETAGQSHGQANDMQLVGIIDAHEFRARIMAGREAARRAHASIGIGEGSSREATGDNALANVESLLREILAVLKESRKDDTSPR